MKNNKGFTLIELLAVMVILAIIALIATPVVMGVITNARKAAAVDSTYGIVKAAEAFYANELLKSGGTFEAKGVKDSGLVDLTTVKGADNVATIEYKGTKADPATIYIGVDGEIQLTATINGIVCEYNKTANSQPNKAYCG